MKTIKRSTNITKKLYEGLGNYLSPSNFTYMWSFGSMALICLLIQILTGLFLSMFYKPDISMASTSVEYINRELYYGWLIRYIQMNGASIFFLVVYLHMAKYIIYGSYSYLWIKDILKNKKKIFIFFFIFFMFLLINIDSSYAESFDLANYYSISFLNDIWYLEKISENCLLQNCILDDTLKHLDLIWSNSKLDCLKYLLEICSEPKGHISNNVDLRFFFENIFKKEFIETISFKEVSNSEAPWYQNIFDNGWVQLGAACVVVTIIIYFIINNGGEPPTTPTPVTPETPTASFDSSLELSKDDIILDFGSKFEPNLDDLVTNNIFWGDIPLEYTLDIKDSERLSCSDELSKLSNISNLEELSNISEDNLDILVNIPQTPEYQISDSEMEAIIFRDINNQPLNLSDTQVFDIFTFFSDKNILEFSEILQQNIFIGEEKKGFFFFTFLISFFFFKKSWVISDFWSEELKELALSYGKSVNDFIPYHYIQNFYSYFFEDMNKVFMSKVNVRYFAEILRLMNQHDFLSAYLLVRQFLYEAFGTPREEALFLEKSLSEIYGVGEDAPLIPDIVFALITELALFMQYCLQILIGKIF